jgi:hypothetical protein
VHNGTWHSVFGIVFDEMTAKGFKPKLQTIDNEASATLKNYFTEKEMNYQLPPPTLPQSKCCRAGNQDFHRTLKNRPRNSGYGILHSLVGYNIAPSGNHTK